VNREELLEDYVARGLEALAAGAAVDPAALCAGHHELADAVAEALGLRHALPALHAASTELDRWLGTALLGRYRLDERIGRGASGSVYRAHDLELRRDVAVKILHRGLLPSSQAEERFLREAVVLARHEHRHVLRVYDRGRTEDGTLWLVTEWLQGRGLQEVLERAQAAMPQGATAAGYARASWLRELLPEADLEPSLLRQVVRWAAELGTGLAAAHRSGVFHRDVKPSNAFLRLDGSAVLLDFGIAVQSGDPSTTLHGAVLGTPWYMPPEQARGRTEPAPTLDVYGLGATLYHLLTLHPPHEGDLQQVLAAAKERDPVPAVRLHAGLPRDLRAILDRSLDPSPQGRYPSVDGMVADLQAFLEHRPVRVRPLGPLGRTLRRVRRHPARALAIAACAVLVLLLFVVVPLWRSVAAARASAERERLVASLPALLALEGSPRERLLVAIGERATCLAVLDRLLELDPDDLATRLLLAAERLDAGDLRGAQRELAELAARSPSPYLQAAAECYARATDSTAGSEAVQFADLPEPQRPEDFFVAGFHALRARDGKTAITMLDRATDYLPARDLRLIALLATARWEEARDEANRLEERYGHPTARTQHTLGAVFLATRHYEQVIPCCERSLHLRPGRHGPWNNLGYAHLRLGHLQQARDCLQQAVLLRPWFDNSRAGLCQVLRSLEQFDAARAEARQVRAAWWRSWELGNVDLAEALAARRDGDLALARAVALSAIEHYRRTGGDADPGNQKQRSAALAVDYAQAIADGDPGRALPPFLDALRKDLRNPTQLMNLAELLQGQDVDGALLDRLRLYLLDLAVDLAPDDPRPQQARKVLVETIEHKER